MRRDGEGSPLEQFAAQTAEQWSEGLLPGIEDGERIARLRDAVELAIYTPGSTAGLPLTVLRSFDAPPPGWSDRSRLIASELRRRSRGCWRSWASSSIQSPAGSTSCSRMCWIIPGVRGMTSTWRV